MGMSGKTQAMYFQKSTRLHASEPSACSFVPGFVAVLHCLLRRWFEVTDVALDGELAV